MWQKISVLTDNTLVLQDAGRQKKKKKSKNEWTKQVQTETGVKDKTQNHVMWQVAGGKYISEWDSRDKILDEKNTNLHFWEAS